MHGFNDQPFRRPTYPTERVLAIELFKHLSIANKAYGSSKHQTILYDVPKSLDAITLPRQNDNAEYILIAKLAHLGLVFIQDEWHYDPDGCLSDRKTQITHMSYPYWEERRCPLVDSSDIHIYPANIIISHLERPKWLYFYDITERMNPTKKINAALKKKLEQNGWQEKQIADFWTFLQEIKGSYS